jgi:hypothetical protein
VSSDRSRLRKRAQTDSGGAAEECRAAGGHADGTRWRRGHRHLAHRWFRVGCGDDSEESRLGFSGAAAARSSGEISDCRSFRGWR